MSTADPSDENRTVVTWVEEQTDPDMTPAALAGDYRTLRHRAPLAVLEGLTRELLEGGDAPGLTADQQAELLGVALAIPLHVPPDRVRQVARDLPPPTDDTLVPAPLPWTQQAVLGSPETVGLDSPVIHAFLVETGETVNEVLVVGRGLGEVRKRVNEIAFLAGLAIRRQAERIDRVYHEAQGLRSRGLADEADRYERFAWELERTHPAQLLDGLIWLSRRAIDPDHQVHLPGPAAEDSQGDPFRLLVDELRRLDRESALVYLHNVSPDEVARFRPGRYKPKDFPKGSAGLFYDPNDDPDRATVAAAQLVRVAAFNDAVEFTVPAPVFGPDSRFAAVAATFLESKLAQAEADAQMRLDFYTRRFHEADRQLAAYEEAQRAGRQAQLEQFHAEEHRLDYGVDHEVGVIFRLPKPDFVTGLRFYTTILPSLRQTHGQWRDRMQAILHNIRLARTEGRLERLAINYFVDRALRNLPALPGDPAWPGLEAWQQGVRPLLLRAWRAALTDQRAKPEDYRTRRLFFTATLEAKGETTWVTVRANYLFVNTTSVIDTRKPVHRLCDRLDAVQPTPAPAPADFSDQALAVALSPGSSNVRAELFRHALLADPRQAVGRVLTRGLSARPLTDLSAAGPNPYRARHLLQQVDSLLYVGANHAAMRLLVEFLDDAIRRPPRPDFTLGDNCLPEVPTRLVLLYTLVNERQARPWRQVQDILRNPDAASLPPRVKDAVALAERWEPGYLARCAEKAELCTSERMKEALRAGDKAGAVSTLLDEASAGLRAAAALSKARKLPRERSDARRLYRLLGDALGTVMACPWGSALDFEVQELTTRLLGAPHRINMRQEPDTAGGTET